MEEEHRELLRSNRVYLTDNLDPSTFSNLLLQEKLLSDNEFELMEAEKTTKHKAEFLLGKLTRKGPDAFGKFLDVLRKTSGQEYIAEHIAKQLEQCDADAAQNGDSSESEDYDASKLTDQYQMKSNPRGRALIINNKHFTNGLRVRTGTNVDADSLEGLFKWLSFKVERLNDRKSHQMQKDLLDFAKADHSKYDCVIVAILSHGENGQIYGTDAKLINVSDLVGYFKDCESLAGKPKLFFLQACRGGIMDDGVNVPDGFDDPDISSATIDSYIANALCGDETDAKLSTLPSDADFLLSYATTPGYVSWRNQARGSWYIDALTQVLYKYADKEHLVDMLVKVNEKVATEFQSSTGAKKQIPAPVVMLTKKLYFKRK